MGAGSSSTRRLEMANEDARILQVTEDVVNILRSSPPPPPPQRASGAAGVENQQSSQQYSAGQPAGIIDVGPDGHPRIETASAYQVRREKEKELRDNDNLWKNKLKDLENRYSASAFASQEKFDSELERLQKLVPLRKSAPCMDMSARVAQCYSFHGTQSLHCSDEVKNFAKCVEGVRRA